MVDVSKLTLAQQQQHAVMLIQHYQKLCNTNKTSSTFLSILPNPNIESLYQSIISSLDSRQCGKNRDEVNIQRPTKSG